MPSIQKLPLFPLSLVLCPSEHLPLHIFEPRYKEMIGRCIETEEPFGIVYSREGSLARVGCTARIARLVRRYADGRLDIIVVGEERFRLGTVHRDEVYFTVDADLLGEAGGPPNRDLKERAITQHMRLLELAGREIRPGVYERAPLVSYLLAHNAGLTDVEKQALLEIMAETDRIAFLIEHFEALIPRIEQQETLRRKIQSNGNIRDFPPAASA